MFLRTDFVAQETIDEDIKRHEHAIQTLKTRRNGHSAICKLPDDILAHILTTAKYDAISLDHRANSAAWAKLLAICRRWRLLAFSTPRFWAMISLFQTYFVDMSIELSKEAPLWLTCPLHWIPKSSESLWASARKIASVSARVEDFSIMLVENKAEVAHDLLLLVATDGIPRLHHLALRASKYTHFGPELPSTVSWMNAAASSLQSLTLENVFIPPDIPPLPSLRRLVITRSLPGEGVSLPWTVQVLRQTPNVEEVQILGLFSSDSIPPVTGDFPISLHKLSELHVTSNHIGKYIREFKLFEYIDFPSSARINAEHFSPHPDESIDLGGLEVLMSRFLSGPRAILVDKVVIMSADTKQKFSMQLFEPDAPRATLSITMPLALSSLDKHIHLLKHRALSSITELELSRIHLASTALAWSNLIPTLPNLKKLSMDDCDEALLNSLCHPPQGDAPSNPKLEVLSDRWAVYKDGGESTEKSSTVSVTDTLRKRIEVGVPLRKLILKECDTTPGMLDKLKEFVEVECID